MSFKQWCEINGIKFSRRKYERPAREVWAKCQAEINSRDLQIKDLLDELGVVGDLLAEINEQLKGDSQ